HRHRCSLIKNELRDWQASARDARKAACLSFNVNRLSLRGEVLLGMLNRPRAILLWPAQFQECCLGSLALGFLLALASAARQFSAAMMHGTLEYPIVI